MLNKIENYCKNEADYFDWKLRSFKPSSKGIKKVIKDAVEGRLPNKRLDSHQYRIKKQVTEEMYRILTTPSNLARLMACVTFEDIFKLIAILAVKGFGPLSVYDTSVRLGTYFNVKPNVVHIQCGSYKGAKNLLGNNFRTHLKHYKLNKKYYFINVNSLPAELQTMDPESIENFLCVMYKKAI